MNESLTGKKFQRGSYLVFICLSAALGGLLFGFDTAVISGAEGMFTKEFGLSAVLEGWVTSSALVGCLFGALMAGWLSDRFGRKKLLLLSAVCFALSAVWCGLAPSPLHLVLARLVGGLGIGIASLVSPLYIAEISPPRSRGILVALQQLAIVLGILGAFLSNNIVLQTTLSDAAKWRCMFAVGAVPAVLFLIMIFPIPESPRWLTKQGLVEKARGILGRVVDPAEADREMIQIINAIAHEGGTLMELWKPGLRRALFVGIILMVFTQFTGIAAIMYYAPKIFTQAGVGTADAYSQTVWVGLINLVFTLLAMSVLDQLGRKPLLLTGIACMGAALAFVGYAFHAKIAGLSVLFGVLAYVGSFAISLGAVSWVLVSEIYPTRTRGRAMSLATAAVWASCFLVSQTFPLLLKHIGPAATFWTYGAMCILAIVFVWHCVPETKGRSLEEIEGSWDLKYK